MSDAPAAQIDVLDAERLAELLRNDPESAAERLVDAAKRGDIGAQVLYAQMLSEGRGVPLDAGEGLHPSSKGARVRFSGQRRSVVDGPFPEAKQLIGGFWLIQVKSKEEAIEWVKRCPNPTGDEAEIEIRQVFEAEDFGAELTPELREQEQRLRTQAARH